MSILEYGKYKNLEGYLFLLRVNGKINRIMPCFCNAVDIEKVVQYFNSSYNESVQQVIKLDIITIDYNELNMDLLGKFQHLVYTKLLSLPATETITYGSLLGKQYARAVGTAMKNNPFPVIIPCHRVVSSNGDEYYSIPCHKHKLCIKNIDTNECAVRIKKMLRKVDAVSE